MDFLLSHLHCIVPMIAIAAVLLLRGMGKKKYEPPRSKLRGIKPDFANNDE